MSQFLRVKTAEEVLRIIGEFDPVGVERVGIDSVCGRVLAQAFSAPEPLPHFRRATMDGYAVRSRDTFGASESLPGFLEVTGEVLMGEPTGLRVEAGQAVAIPTGGMVPEGADAVVMVEYTQTLDENTIEVTKPVAPGDNILDIGEDIAEGEVLFSQGWRMRPQDVGVLASLGVQQVQVYKKPRVAVISTGDEIVPSNVASISPGKIRDINSAVLAAQVKGAWAQLGQVEIVVDDLTRLTQSCRRALEDHDVVLLSGGSSLGARDYTLNILDQFEDARLLVHGIAIRPGKPTILAQIGRKIFCGLPGQPASAMIVFTAFVRPLLTRLQGLQELALAQDNTRQAILSRQLPSVHGRADYIRVALAKRDNVLEATPIFGKSAMMSTLINAGGYVIVPEHVEGFDRGTEVTVHLFHVG